VQETFDLYSEEGDVLLTHEGDGYDTYDATLFYAVRPAPHSSAFAL
jgi:hypothetical protein